MVLFCQNQDYSGTSGHYWLYSSASISVQSTSATVIVPLKKNKEKKKELVENGVLAICRFAT